MHYTHHAAFAALLATTGLAQATPVEFEIVIKDHQFTPSTLIVPVDKKIKLKVINADATAEEFESYKLNREKIIPGNSKAVVFIGPLEAGEYDFFGEFNPATAQGKIIAQ
ncbi:MAG: cupredoxin domain-containing protein [Gammaproteobacteria bacterium]|nr:cupredoxin domain-containing protein [Gammaproteobacteria bacterium]